MTLLYLLRPCPPSLKVSAFTTTAIDNIAHNPSSNTATSSFHGKTILLFQYLPLGKGDEKEVPDFQIKQKNLKKTAIFLHRHNTSNLQQDNHDQEPNALNGMHPKRFAKYKNK